MKLEIKGEFVDEKHVTQILSLINTMIFGHVKKGSFTSVYDPGKPVTIEWELKE